MHFELFNRSQKKNLEPKPESTPEIEKALKQKKLRTTAIAAIGLTALTASTAKLLSPPQTPEGPTDEELKITRILQTNFPLVSTEEGLRLIKKGMASKVDEIGTQRDETTWIVDLKSGKRVVFHMSAAQREKILTDKKIDQKIFEAEVVRPAAGMELDKQRMSFLKNTETGLKEKLLLQLTPLILLLGVYGVLFKKMGIIGGSENKELETTGRPKERLTDFGGEKALIAEARELITQVERFKNGDPSIQLPTGILLSGSPGIGKTHFARCLAGEADCTFIAPNSAALLSSSFVGVWVKAIQGVFQKARDTIKQNDKKNKKSGKREVVIIFLDEIDSFAQARSTSGDPVSKEYNKVVNALLQELDGVDKKRNAGIIVIGATNLPDTIDPALLRPGRFTERFAMKGPQTADERLDVLRVVARHVCTQSKLDEIPENILNGVANASKGLTPDQLRAVLSRAADVVKRSGGTSIPEETLFSSFQHVLCGPAQDALVDSKRVQFVAMHEHGHGIVAHACGVTPLIISMRPRGDSLGRVIIAGDQLTDQPIRRADILKAMLIAAGGRAGELADIGIGGESAGVLSDFQQLESLADLFLRSGMASRRYDGASNPKNEGPFSDEYRQLRMHLINSAIRAAEEIITLFGQQKLEELSEAHAREHAELVGDNASTFYDKHIDASLKERMESIVENFIESPLVEEGERKETRTV